MHRTATVLAAALISVPAFAQPLDTAFSYQGRLTVGGGAPTGVYDFQFDVFDVPTGSAPVAPSVFKDDVAVTNGLFTVSLDFGATFTGNKRWLEVSVRPGTSTGGYTVLVPRQELTPAPYALSAAGVVDGAITDADVSASAAVATSKLSGPVTAIAGHGLGALATLSAVAGGPAGTIADGTVANADLAPGSFTAITGVGALTDLTVTGTAALGTAGIGTATPWSSLDVVGPAGAPGTGTISSSGTTVTGSGTAFVAELQLGDVIAASGQKRTVVVIGSNTSLVVNPAFAPAIPGGTIFSIIRSILRVRDAASGTRVLVNDVGVGIGGTPGAALDVAGEIHHDGVLQVGLSAPTSYEVSTLRYVVEAPPSVVGRVIPLDPALTDQLCRDRDGCEVTLQMVNWDVSQPGNVASRSERLFVSQTSRWWRFANIDVSGEDNDLALHEWTVFDCFFTDAELYTGTPNGRSDSTLGFGLLDVAGGAYSDATTTCRVVIVD